MKRLTTALFVLLTFAISILMISSPAYAKTYKGLFVYWRGETPCGEGFKEGLKNLGFEIDAVEFNAETDKKKLISFLSSVNEKDYDFVYTFGTTVSVTAAKYIKNTPIFFGIVTDPVKAGLTKSWESSGNNVTGVSHNIPYKDQVGFILSLGKLQKIGFVYNPKEQNSVIGKGELEALFKQNGIALLDYPVNNDNEIPSAVSRIIADKPDLVYLPSDSFILSNGDKIIPALTAAKIPTYGALEKYLDELGAMIGIVSSYRSVGLELASNAAEVFRGKAPTDVPSKTLPDKMLTIKVTGKTVEQTGFEIPYEILSLAQIKK